MKTPLAEAIDLCRVRGIDFWSQVQNHAATGYVILAPDCVCLVEQVTTDTLFVWLAIGRGYLGKLCLVAPDSIRFIQWACLAKNVDRGHETRQFDFRRVRALFPAKSAHVVS